MTSSNRTIRSPILFALCTLAAVLGLTLGPSAGAAQDFGGPYLIVDHLDTPASGTNLGAGIQVGWNGLFGSDHVAGVVSFAFLPQEIDADPEISRASYFDFMAAVTVSPVTDDDGWRPYLGLGFGWILTTREGGQVGPLNSSATPVLLGVRSPARIFLEVQYWGRLPEAGNDVEGKARRLAALLGLSI